MERFVCRETTVNSFLGKTIKEIALEMGNSLLLTWCEITLSIVHKKPPALNLRKDAKLDDPSHEKIGSPVSNLLQKGTRHDFEESDNKKWIQKISTSIRKFKANNSTGAFNPPAFLRNTEAETKFVGDIVSPNIELRLKSPIRGMRFNH